MRIFELITALLLVLLVIVGVAMVVAWPASYLWNVCMPHLFGVSEADYWTMVAFVMLWGGLLRPVGYSNAKVQKGSSHKA